MLIRFNVRNFLSFNTTEKNSSEEFSMIAGKSEVKKIMCMMMGRLSF